MSSERVYLRKNGKWEARYVKGKLPGGKTRYGAVFADTREEAIARREAMLGRDPDDPYSASRLRILILGAGCYGRDVKDELDRMHMFDEIAFLDDYSDAYDIKGKCEEAEMYKHRYSCAFVAIGDNSIRRKYAEMLRDIGFRIPAIVSPDAIVSSKAKIGMGTMIFAQANVGAAEVGDFCLVQANGLVNAETKVEGFCRIDNGAIVLKGERLPEGSWLKPGKIYGEV